MQRHDVASTLYRRHVPAGLSVGNQTSWLGLFGANVVFYTS